MLNRIKKLIEKKNLTATQFAGEIGVQRSAVSHLLSGRNKASLDFVLKIKNRFPEINLEWLLLGSGKMMEMSQKEETNTKNVEEELFQKEVSLKTEGQTSAENQPKEPEMPFNIVKSEDAPSYGAQGKESEQLPQKVILLYPDNTFKVFNSH